KIRSDMIIASSWS
ncbi:hypothetical protein D039_3045, partial [Vibrio parahaemolyticus EKP-028]